MKKLFSVLLVLALCGIAIATTVDFYITDSAGHSYLEMSPSATVNLYLWYTGDAIVSFDTIIAGTGPGTLSATVGSASDWYPPQAMPNILATGRDIAFDAVFLGMDFTDPDNPVLIPNSYEMTGSAWEGQLELGLANPLAWVAFHMDNISPPAVMITLTNINTFDTNWAPVVPTMHGMTILGIPEPATLSLLALGGLALLGRRHRAVEQ